MPKQKPGWKGNKGQSKCHFTKCSSSFGFNAIWLWEGSSKIGEKNYAIRGGGGGLTLGFFDLKKAFLGPKTLF